MGEKIEFPWEAEIPITCRNCTNARYIYSLAHDAYRGRNESEAMRAAIREAMLIGGKTVHECVDKWIGGRK